MQLTSLARRNVIWYWRTNLAVVAGVAVAVAVLAGALLVGASVRSSLRALALERLGGVDHVVTSLGFVREALAEDLLAADGMGRRLRSGRAAGGDRGVRHAPAEPQPRLRRAGVRRR